MENLKKIYERNDGKEIVGDVLEKAGFEKIKGADVYLKTIELDTATSSILVNVDLKEEIIEFEFSHYHFLDENKSRCIKDMDIVFTKEISDEALIDLFGKESEPIILDEIQENIAIIQDNMAKIIFEQEEIQKKLK